MLIGADRSYAQRTSQSVACDNLSRAVSVKIRFLASVRQGRFGKAAVERARTIVCGNQELSQAGSELAVNMVH